MNAFSIAACCAGVSASEAVIDCVASVAVGVSVRSRSVKVIEPLSLTVPPSERVPRTSTGVITGASLLPVIDSFEAGLSAEHLELETLLEGQRATLRLLQQAFTDAGIEPIDPIGERFDPQQHEAMSMLSAPAAEPDSVIDVIQKGYSLRSRLLRPARVIVAKPPEGADG